MLELEPTEEILYTARAHWFVFFSRVLMILALACVPLLLYVLVPGEVRTILTGQVAIEGNVAALFVFVYFLWLLMLWILLAIFWTDYYLDVWYITNERVISVDQLGLFNRHITSTRLEMIQDVSVEVPGFLQTLLHFGTIRLATAGPEKSFVFRGVGRPHVLKGFLMSEHRKVQEKPQEVRVVPPQM
ncbi:MAG: PH domain-containing protein [bacterium]|nr:PH domain-containing protein [bacterium]